MPRYFLYARFSDKPQQYGSSEERQIDLDKHRRRAAELSAELVEVPYIDRGKSGFHGEHLEAELGRIKGNIQSGVIRKGDILWAESHSRLGRLTPPEAMMEYLGILRSGIRLDIKGQLRSWESIGRDQGLPTLMMDFIEMFTVYGESLQKQKHARDTNALKRRKLLEGIKEGVMHNGTPGWFVGDRCPAWLAPLAAPNADAYLYEIVESVASVIRMIFDWREDGVGCFIIAQRLTEMGAEPFANAHIVNPEKRITSGWSQSMVARVLRDEAVIGRYYPRVMECATDENGEPIRTKRIAVKVSDDPVAYYPPVIHPGQFWRLRAIIREADKSGNSGRTGKHFSNLVRGLSRCPCCDGPVNLWSRVEKGHPEKTMRYLKCEHARRKAVFPEGHPLAGQRCPNRRGFPYPRFEELLLALFSPAMIPVLADILPKRHPDDLVERRIADIDAKIAEAQQAIQRFTRLIRKAPSDDIVDEYDAEIRKIRAELGTLTVERDRLNEQRARQGENRPELIADVVAQLTQVGDPQTCYDTRAKLNQLLAGYIRVVLNADRTITVGINEHSGLNPVEARLSVEGGLESIDVIDRDGIVLTHFDKAGLVLLEPIQTRAA